MKKTSTVKYDSAPSHTFTSFPETHSNPNDNEDLEKLLDDPELTGERATEKQYSYSNIEFYQKYFNVSTNDVIYRVIGSMTPTFNQSFLLNKIRPNPDLYGPFWICISLIFTIAIAGNIVSFMHNFGSDYKWHTDFHKVTSSAATILIYWWLMPTILYVLMRWRKVTTEFTFIEILCIYGYSLFIYIPVAMLWTLNIVILQWLLVLAAILLSGSVLVFTFWTPFSAERKFAFGVMILILAFHAALGISFMLYFFHYPVTIDPHPIIPSNGTNQTSFSTTYTSSTFSSTFSNLTTISTNNSSSTVNPTLTTPIYNSTNTSLVTLNESTTSTITKRTILSFNFANQTNSSTVLS